MSKKILVLKNQGSLKLESQDWIQFSIYNYQRMIIDGKNSYLLKKPGTESFCSLQEVLLKVEGVMIFVSDSSAEVIRGILSILNDNEVPHVLLMEECSKEISSSENEVFAVDNEIESIILALNKLSALIDNKHKIKFEKKPLKIQNSLSNNIKDTIEKSKKEILEEYSKNKEKNMDQPVKPLKDVNTQNQVKQGIEQKEMLKPKKLSKNQFNPALISSLDNNVEKLKKIKFNLHPIMMNQVKDALGKLGFSNITVTEIKYIDADKKSETYRGSHYKLNLAPRLEVMMVVKGSEIDYILNILSQLKNDDIGDYACIYNTEDTIRISSNEHGNIAVD